MAQRVRLYVRYYAATDASAIGRAALEYLKSLLRIAPVRVLSITGGAPSGPWEGFSSVLATPIGPTFVNVVCCDPSRWAWTQKVEIPNVQDGKVVSTEKAERHVELYTQGCRNVLLVASSAHHADQVRAAARYEAIVASEHQIAARLEDALQVTRVAFGQGPEHKKTPLVIPVPVSDHDVMRRVIMP
jgi:hypothetical protein